MRAKLTHSQKILEGLLAEDFDMIVANSQRLNLLTRAVEWQMLEAAEYTQRSTDFRRSLDKLTQAAKQKNLDGAALAYIDITIKCLQCHEYIRKL
jgi:cytochrome c556